jgi:hypothetical protein
MNPMLTGFEKYLPPGVLGFGGDAEVQAALLSQRRQMSDSAISPRDTFRAGLQGLDAATGGGQVFLESELEKRDPKVREPLASVTYMRDIPIKSGGGWVDFTSNLFADYAISGPNGLGIQANNTTTIPIVQTNVLKDVYRTFAWGNILRVPFIDMQKLQGAGRSLDDMLDKGIKLNWNKTLDQFTYLGPFSNTSYPGLLNNPNITAGSVAAGAAGGTKWTTKTPAEILNDVNQAMVLTTAASQYDVTGMANHICIPWSQYAYIAATPVTAAGSVSILTYLLENNIGKTQGVDLKIFPLRWCLGAGSGSADRMLAYVNNDDRVQLDVTVPIQRIMTVPNISTGGGAYDTLYQGQIGVVKFLYLQCALYQDGI